MAFDFKHASEADRKKEYDRIAKEIGDDNFFTKKELNYLPEALADGEQVLAFTSGFLDGNTWLLTLTDRRLIFLDKGMLYGLKQTSIDLDKVNSVTSSTGLIFGSITIQDGASSRLINNVSKKSIVAFTNKVQGAIEARKTPQQQPQKNASNEVDDVTAKLERLASLLEKGILTPEEFAQQKAKLLA